MINCISENGHQWIKGVGQQGYCVLCDEPKPEPLPLRYDAEGLRRVHDSLDAIGDTFMIQWLTGVGRFDTNDPCDEWPLP